MSGRPESGPAAGRPRRCEEKVGSWRCPACSRAFARPHQRHSHSRRTVESHFEGRPESRAVYDALVKGIGAFGPLRVDAVKTSINLIARHHLGGLKVLKDGIRIGFVLGRKLADRRILKASWVGGSKYAHSVKLTSPDEVDEQLLAWLGEAYRLAAGPKS
jgi:hypothetical protein